MVKITKKANQTLINGHTSLQIYGQNLTTKGIIEKENVKSISENSGATNLTFMPH